MNETASKLSGISCRYGYERLEPLGPQLMAEINVPVSLTKVLLLHFAGVDPGVNLEPMNKKVFPTSKRGSADLRKTLFQVMDIN